MSTEPQQHDPTLLFTSEDLRAAIYSNQVDNNTELYRHAPVPEKLATLKEQIAHYESQLNSPIDGDKEDERLFWTITVANGIKQYQRGKAVLEKCEVITSDARVVLGSVEDMLPNRAIISPVEVWPAGYVATSPRLYYITLAYKKGSAEELAYFAQRAVQETAQKPQEQV